MNRELQDRVPIDTTAYSRFEARPVTGTFGAHIEGIQIADAIDNDTLFQEIRSAWVKYQVLFFRDQDLDCLLYTSPSPRDS